MQAPPAPSGLLPDARRPLADCHPQQIIAGLVVATPAMFGARLDREGSLLPPTDIDPVFRRLAADVPIGEPATGPDAAAVIAAPRQNPVSLAATDITGWAAQVMMAQAIARTAGVHRRKGGEGWGVCF